MATVKEYRLRVHDRGTTAPTDLTVDFTLGLQELVEPPSLPGALVKPIEGQTQAQAWTFPVIDRAGAISAHLSDPATGRMWLLGRLVEVQDTTDGGAWTTIGTGRLADLDESGDPGLFTLRVEDERWVERHGEIFTTAGTAQVWPSARHVSWRGFSGAFSVLTGQTLRSEVTAYEQVFTSTNKAVRLNAKKLPFSDSVRSWIAADLHDGFDPHVSGSFAGDPSTGNFRNLRLNVGGVDYGIVWFGRLVRGGDSTGPADPSAFDTDQLWVNVLDPNGTLSAASVGAVAYLHAPTAEPSPENPLHVGMNHVQPDGSNWGTTTGYIHPFLLAQRIYDKIGVRYDPAVFAALVADTSYPPLAQRITSKAGAAKWLEDYVYKPNQVVPFVDSQGRVAPKSVRLPTNLDPTTLFVFTASNTSRSPSFEHSSRDVLNSLTFRGERMRTAQQTGDPPLVDSNWPVDSLITREVVVTEGTDDGVSEGVFGRREAEFSLEGIKHPGEFRVDSEAQQKAAALYDSVIARIKREVLDRFQDGPIRGTIAGLAATEVVEPGDLVVLDHDSLKGPNPVTNDRTGQRIVQVIRRTRTVEGPEFEFLDVGPKLQPLPAPAVDIRLHSTEDDRLEIEISSVPVGATVTLQVGFGDTDPPIWSRTWTGLGAEVVEITRPPAGTTAWARAQTTAPGRIRSIWAQDSVVVPGIPRVLGSGISLEGGVPIVQAVVNAFTAGIRLYYATHRPDVDPGTLTVFQDFAAATGEWTLVGVTVPGGHAITVKVEPWSAWTGSAVGGVAGPAELLTARRGLLTIPTFTGARQRAGADSLHADFEVTVADPEARGGRLHAWLNAGASGSADPSGAEDGYVDIAETPATVDASTIWSTATALLNEIRVHPGQGKEIYLEFITDSAISSGVQRFTLRGPGGAVDEDDGLLDGIITDLTQFGPGLSAVVSAADQTALDALPLAARVAVMGGELYRRDGSDVWSKAVQTVDLVGDIVANTVADGSITQAHFAAGIEPVGIDTSANLPTTKTTELIYWSGKLYQWNTVDGNYQEYVAAVGSTTTVNTENIADAAVTAAKIGAGAVTTAKLALLSVTEAVVAAGAITADKIGAAAVTAAKIGLAAVQTANIASAAVTAALIATGAVGTAQLADASVGLTKFASGITPVEIVSNLPTTGNFAGRTVSLTTDGKLYRYSGGAFTAAVPATDLTGTVVTAQIADSAITAAKIGALAVQTANIATAAITNAKIDTNAVTAAKILAGAVTADKIATSAVTTAKLNAAAVTSDKIADAAITAAKIGAAAVQTANIATAAITTALIASAAITETQIAADSITTPKIAAGAVTANEIAAGAVTATQILAGSVTTAKLAAGAVTANELAANSVTAGKIGAGVITATEIAAGAITTEKLAVGSRSLPLNNFSVTGTLTGWTLAGAAAVTSQIASVAKDGRTVQAHEVRTSGNTLFESTKLEIDPNTTYEVRLSQMLDAASAAGGVWYLGVECLNASSVEIGLETFDPTTRTFSGSLTTNAYLVAGENSAVGAWRNSIGYVLGSNVADPDVVPAGQTVTRHLRLPADARYLRIRYLHYNNAGTERTRWFYSPEISPIGVTLIHGNTIQTGTLNANRILANSITAAQILAGAITSTELATNSVTAVKIVAGAITTAKIAAGAITTTELAANSVTAGKIAADQITGNHILAGAIETSRLAAGAVTAEKIAADTITAAQIAAGAISTSELAALAVTAAKIAAGTITATQIAANTITAAQILAGAITSTELATNSVTAVKIVAGAITTAKLAAGAVTANEIASNAVTAVKILAATITGDKIAAATITASNIVANTITAAQIAAGTISATEIASGAVTTAKLAALAVTADKIAANSITASQIAADAITSSELAANSVIAGKIAAGAISATEIAAGAITTDKLASRSIVASKLLITNFDNLTQDPSVEDSALNWTLGTGWAVNTSVNSRSGTKRLQFTGSSANAINPLQVECNPGDKFYAEAWLFADTTDGQAFVRLAWLDAAGAELSADAGTLLTQGTAGGVWAKSSGMFTAPTAARFVRAGVGVVSRTTGTWYADDLSMRKGTAGEIIVDGTLTASKIATDAITSDKIAANAITAAKIDTNAVTAAKILAGAVTADKLAANSIVAGKIAAGAINAANLIVDGVITAGKLSVAELSAIAATLGTINAGVINNLSSNPTRGIRLDGGSAKPGTWTDYLDLAAIGADPVLKVGGLEILADGSTLVQDSVVKTIRYSHHGFRPFSSTDVYNSALNNTFSTDPSADWGCPILIPVGATITRLQFRGAKGAAGHNCQCTLYRQVDGGPNTIVAQSTITTTGVQNVIAFAYEVVQEGYTYLLSVFTTFTAGTAPSFEWAEIQYTSANYRQTL